MGIHGCPGGVAVAEHDGAANLEFDSRHRFSVGVGTQLEVLDSQVALTDARSNRVQALYDYNLANAQLVRAVGIDSKVKELNNK